MSRKNSKIGEHRVLGVVATSVSVLIVFGAINALVGRPLGVGAMLAVAVAVGAAAAIADALGAERVRNEHEEAGR